ncbi:MAG: hypothetical protein GY807_22780 [Gammaproteobacteria bacterium]|nr:hypothetical protein [Gammaproteobacteria bacterium]
MTEHESINFATKQGKHDARVLGFRCWGQCHDTPMGLKMREAYNKAYREERERLK